MTYRRFLLVLAVFLTIVASFVCWQGIEEHFSPLETVGQYRVHHQGENFTIDVASNPTTGYTWIVSEPSSNNLKLDKPIYQAYPAKEGQTGTGGFSRISGAVVADGRYQFQLIYAQDWQGGETALMYQVTLLSQKQEIKELRLTKMDSGKT